MAPIITAIHRPEMPFSLPTSSDIECMYFDRQNKYLYKGQLSFVKYLIDDVDTI